MIQKCSVEIHDTALGVKPEIPQVVHNKVKVFCPCFKIKGAVRLTIQATTIKQRYERNIESLVTGLQSGGLTGVIVLQTPKEVRERNGNKRDEIFNRF